ncbi:ryptide family R-Y-crosslinked RiPP peptide [Staphylococcus pseudintermedius]|nr:ryptide family R-Y-crosslinked RiPP peptide [Staphylococcus pseudintermedius]MDT0898299.1 ryptide family R-Y-crosslinked RiPP peptide [Staphylococcus pseudintermedius]MDT0932246.1 ryptide family R-Y-crosslinked RiPP peptide [Staphylococcus pseudintermedius]
MIIEFTREELLQMQTIDAIMKSSNRVLNEMNTSKYITRRRY